MLPVETLFTLPGVWYIETKRWAACSLFPVIVPAWLKKFRV